MATKERKRSLRAFYWSILRTALSEELLSAKEKVEKALTMVFAILLAINKQIGEHAKATWQGISPWWAALPVGLLVLWNLLRANFERFEEERKAREIAEEREHELLSARQLKQEWERLEGRFKEFPAKLLAGWSQVVPIVNEHDFGWSLFGDSERNAKELMVVIEEAGNLLKTSHFGMNQFPWLKNESIAEHRWLNYLRENVRDAKNVRGSGSEHGVSYESGSIYEVANESSLYCAVLKAKEKWPSS